MFKTHQEIEDFLEKCNVNMYKIHDDLSVDILDEKVDFSKMELEIIPFKINFSLIKKINLSDNSLKSTKGLPRSLKYLSISYTPIKYLEDLPEGLEVLYAFNNSLKSKDGLPTGCKIFI
jgi:hypothetical protein